MTLAGRSTHFVHSYKNLTSDRDNEHQRSLPLFTFLGHLHKYCFSFDCCFHFHKLPVNTMKYFYALPLHHSLPAQSSSGGWISASVAQWIEFLLKSTYYWCTSRQSRLATDGVEKSLIYPGAPFLKKTKTSKCISRNKKGHSTASLGEPLLGSLIYRLGPWTTTVRAMYPLDRSSVIISRLA